MTESESELEREEGEVMMDSEGVTLWLDHVIRWPW